MNDWLLAALVLLASVSGLWAWLDWRQQRNLADEQRPMLHGASAALVLLALLLSLDNHAQGDAPRLLAGFLAIATGMLMFLQRQRLKKFSRGVLLAHVGASLALLLVISLV